MGAGLGGFLAGEGRGVAVYVFGCGGEHFSRMSLCEQDYASDG